MSAQCPVCPKAAVWRTPVAGSKVLGIHCRVRLTGRYGILAAQALPLHARLMLAARITLPHFSVSSAMNLPKSAAEPGIGMPPASAKCCLVLGSASAELISLLSVSMISEGVFLGTPIPFQFVASYPGTDLLNR